jgi:hypothetical protein
LTKPIKGLVASLVVGAAILLIVPAAMNHKRNAEKTRLVEAQLESKLENLQAKKAELDRKLKEVSFNPNRLDQARAMVRQQLGIEVLTEIEQPLCAVWKRIATANGFAVDDCAKPDDLWTMIRLTGPRQIKSKLYRALEASYHPVAVRACQVEKLDGDSMTIRFLVMDEFHDDSAESKPTFSDAAELDQTTGGRISTLRKQIAAEVEAIDNLTRQMADHRRAVRQSTLLLHALVRGANPSQGAFDLDSIEKSTDKKIRQMR